MCNFFSFVTEPEYHGGQRFYFNARQRKNIGDEIFGEPDSHSMICRYYKLNEDICNKYEYNFIKDELVLDRLNSRINDFVQVRNWVSELNINRIVAKPPFNLGDVYVFRPLQDIKRDARKGLIRFGWIPNMDYLVKEKIEFKITQEFIDNYYLTGGELTLSFNTDPLGWHISLDMLQLKK